MLASLALLALTRFPSAGVQELPSLPIGEVVAGEVDAEDREVRTPELDRDFADAPVRGRAWRVEASSTGTFVFELRSQYFDAYLVLRRADGEVLAQDDDGLFRQHARVVAELGAGEEYVLEACALHGAEGPFELESYAGPPRGPVTQASELERARRRIEELERAERPSEALASALDDLVLQLMQLGRLAGSEELSQRSLEVRRQLYGDEDPRVGTSEYMLGELARLRQDLRGAVERFRRTLAIWEKTLGPDAPDVAEVLARLSYCEKALGDYAAAVEHGERAAAAYERRLGPRHPETALQLNNLGDAYRATGRYDEARAALERALDVYEEVSGPDSEDVALVLNNLGAVASTLGDEAAARAAYVRVAGILEERPAPDPQMLIVAWANLARVSPPDESRALYERALAAAERLYGPEHVTVAGLARRLGARLVASTEFEAARPLLERALEIHERVLGGDHVEVAEDLNTLALLARELLDYETAQPLLERALAVFERALGTESPRYAIALNNLATNLLDLGDLARARDAYERALAATERVFGADNPNTLKLRLNLALVLDDLGREDEGLALMERILAQLERDPRGQELLLGRVLRRVASARLDTDVEEAEALAERALAVIEDELGGEHPQVAEAASTLAEARARMGDLDGARTLFERAVAITSAVYGPDHPSMTSRYNNLATLLRRAHDPGAVELFERALALHDASGLSAADGVGIRTNLAASLLERGETRRAWEALVRGRDTRRARTWRVLATLDEEGRFRYLDELKRHLSFTMGFALELDDPDVRVQAYEELLEWKGRIGRLTLASRERLAAAVGPEERALLRELRGCQRELSTALSAAEGTADATVGAGGWDALLARREQLERELQRVAAPSRPDPVGFGDLRAALAPDQAAVDLFLAPPFERRADGRVELGGEHLIAWVTRGDATRPALVDLGGAELADAARAFLERFGQGAGPARGVQPGARSEAEAEVETGVALRRLLWDPLAPLLDGAAVVFVSPDALIGALPFEVLPLDDGTRLVEQRGFVYLQDLASLGVGGPPAADAPGRSLLAVGNVDFDRREDGAPAGPAAREEDDGAAVEAGTSRSTLRAPAAAWTELPGTELELEALAALHERAFGADARRLTLRRAEATEERLKRELPRFDVLHLATHGYFRAAAGDEAGRSLAERAPGLLSGIVCAGANVAPGVGADDGYLTAEEVGWLDLSGVDVVVLSACETGLGRVRSGEGLIGLRRAFRTAGARTVISSLWQVDDAATAELMRGFYANLWQRGMGRLEALRAAQLELLRRNRERDGDALPSTWGAFVLSGEWR